MICFSSLPSALAGAGAAGLDSLAQTPTSRAAFGILAERIGVAISAEHCCGDFDVYACEDRYEKGITIRQPFAMVAVDVHQAAQADRAAELYERLSTQLRDMDLHEQPVLLVTTGPPGDLQAYLENDPAGIVVLSCADLVAILVAHPPRTEFIRHIRRHTPLSVLNPYVYTGPVAPNMFVGREAELGRLCRPDASFALVGPRGIGKTSLVNRAGERMRSEGHLVVRAEMSPHWSELDLVNQILDRFVREYQADPVVLLRGSLDRLERLIQDYAVRYERDPERPGRRVEKRRHTVCLIIDEADRVIATCPAFLAMLQSLRDRGWCRSILVGYKQLRKAVSDVKGSSLANVLQEFPLGPVRVPECGALVVRPMVELGIEIQDPQRVVDAIYRASGGSPSRIQMLCHHLVEAVDSQARRLTPEAAEAAIDLPQVRRTLANWFAYSTSDYEKWLAAVASSRLPCTEDELIAAARDDLGDISTHQARREIQDLMTANVLTYLPDRRLAFAFPAMQELARPAGDSRTAWAELRHTARAARRTVEEHPDG